MKTRRWLACPYCSWRCDDDVIRARMPGAAEVVPNDAIRVIKITNLRT
jgi:hypothetical protein